MAGRVPPHYANSSLTLMPHPRLRIDRAVDIRGHPVWPVSLSPLLSVAPSLPCVVVSLVLALLGRATSDVPSMCCVEWAAHSLVIVCAMRGGAALCWSVLVALPPGLLASLSLCVVGPGSITSALYV